MKTMKKVYVAILVILVAIIFIFISHGWWFATGAIAFLVMVGMINGYDIIMLNKDDENHDEADIRRRAAYFMSLSEEDKKRYYEQMDKKTEEEFEPKNKNHGILH